MAQKASNLTELIKVQKEAIKILTALNRKEMASCDDAEILELREQQEQIQATLEQTKINVQEAAISMATQADVVEPEVMVAEAPKARRTSWRWEMVDARAATKAGLTLVIPDKENIDLILAEKRKLETECTENGIRYYQERSY